MQKLVYLRLCLSDRASDKIESLETTDGNYQVAWNILEKFYDDSCAVIDNHIKALFELSACTSASSTLIGDLLNNVTKHYRALEASNKPFLEAFPIYAVTSKLDSQTKLKWKEHTQGDKSPTMEKLLEFLHCREKILESTKAPAKKERYNKNAARSDNQVRNFTQKPSQNNSI